MTPAMFVERLVDEYDRAQRFAAVGARYAAPVAADDCDAETAEWDTTIGAGLDGA